MSIVSVAFASEDETEFPIELRQLRYFVRAVEAGSIRRAATELGISTVTLTQDLAMLEAQLTTQLLRRSRNGLIPTDAGVAFFRHAQITLQHAVDAVQAARAPRLVGHVSIGLPPSIAMVMGVPFVVAMRQRYPAVRVQLIEALSGHLAAMLDARKVDLALVARGSATRRWRAMPLIDERVYLLGRPDLPGFPVQDAVSLADLRDLPLVMPTGSHGLRTQLDIAFDRAGVQPHIVYEVDGLALLMDLVSAGLGATLQPAAVVSREPGAQLRALAITDSDARRQTMIAHQADEELSPAALAARVVLFDVTRELTLAGRWTGTTFHDLNAGAEAS